MKGGDNLGVREKIIKILGGQLRETVVSSDNAGMAAIFGPPASKSGVLVSEESAMRFSAVYACVRILSESIASLPLKLYKRGPDDSKKPAINHPLYSILHDKMNNEQTAFEAREQIVAHLCLWGNAYLKKVYDPTGRLVELIPIEPWKVFVSWDKTRAPEYQKRFYVTEDGVSRPYFKSEIMHIPGLSLDGKTGLSPIAYAREAVGLGLAAEIFGSNYFGQGTNMGGTLETPNALSDAAYRRLKADLKEKRQGLDNSHSTMILEEGLKYNKTTIPPEDSQFIETRKFQLNEICRIFRVPPHLVADLDKATFSNIEHQSIEFVVHTLRPWLVRIEQAIFMQLLTDREQKTYFVEHKVDGLLRGDIKSRYDSYAVARQNGWMNADDIRSLENMDPLPDGQGKIYLVNGNMISISAANASTAGKGGENNNGGSK